MARRQTSRLEHILALHRQWRLLFRLHGLRGGLSIRALLGEFGISRSTLYRDFNTLAQAGFPIDTDTQNGEARYRLLGKAMPGVQPTLRQTQALRIARRLLAPLQGTRIVRELDALLPRKDPVRGDRLAVEVRPPEPLGEPKTTTVVEKAMLESTRLAFTYSPAQGEPRERTVDPLALYVRDGQLYLNAVDVAKGALRTFKIARMSAARALEESAGEHPEYDEARVFAHAAKIWDGPLVDVVVRISARGARFVDEWPLIPSQTVEQLPDGAVLVRARVSGTTEAMRWVLRWGKEARVIEPAELRAEVVTEMLSAIAAYTDPVSQRGETT